MADNFLRGGEKKNGEAPSSGYGLLFVPPKIRLRAGEIFFSKNTSFVIVHCTTGQTHRTTLECHLSLSVLPDRLAEPKLPRTIGHRLLYVYNMAHHTFS